MTRAGCLAFAHSRRTESRGCQLREEERISGRQEIRDEVYHRSKWARLREL